MESDDEESELSRELSRGINPDQFYAALDDEDPEMDDQNDFIIDKPFGTISESKLLLKNSMLITCQVVFEMAPSILSTIMVGHYYDGDSKDGEYISALGLATTFAYVTGEVITWGFTTALFTLTPQATGYADPEIPLLEQTIVKNALAIHLQRSFIVTLLVSVPCIILQFFSGPLMTLVGEPSDIESFITQYTVSLIPWLVGSGIFAAIQRVSQALDLNLLFFFVTLFDAVAAFPLMYILMYWCDLGFIGTGIAQSILMWVIIIISILILTKKGYGFLFDFRVFGTAIILDTKELKNFIKLSLPGLFQYALEWGVLEIAMITSGYIGHNSNQETIALSTAVICYDLYLIMWSAAIGFSNAINVRVGQFIGGNNIYFAKKSARLGFIICSIFCVLIVSVLLITRNDITLIFTHNKQTRNTVKDVLFLFCFYAVFLIIVQSFGGLYRGLGAQDKSATFVLIAYYVVSIPLLFGLLFGAKWREDLILGSCTVWGSLGLGNFIAVIICVVYMIRKVSWGDAAHKSTIQMEKIRSLSTPNSDSKSKMLMDSFGSTSQNDDLKSGLLDK